VFFIVWWRGWGCVVVAVAFVAMCLAILVTYALGVYSYTTNVLGLFLILAGVFTWFLGKRMNRDRERRLIDPATGQDVILRSDHSLFSIRVEWWAPVMIVLGVILLVLGLF
jgi:hypothetical protein